jgi:hypothetical protein
MGLTLVACVRDGNGILAPPSHSVVGLMRALRATKAPRDRQRPSALSLSHASLQSLITVAVELEYIDASLALHAQALRESLNLIHPLDHHPSRNTRTKRVRRGPLSQAHQDEVQHHHLTISQDWDN